MSVYYLDALTAADCELARAWRNTAGVRPGLRTALMLTAEQQAAWYRDVVCDRQSPHRYWAVRRDSELLALAGLTDIRWEDGRAEISLLVDPAKFGAGIGTAALRLVLVEAFDAMGLVAVFGEVYDCNPAAGWWARWCECSVHLPHRKRWAGTLHGSTVFWFTPDGRWRP